MVDKRKREARHLATRTGVSYTRALRQVARPGPGRPRIEVVTVPGYQAPAYAADLPQWGVAERTGTGYRITRGAVRMSLHDLAPVPVDYTHPGAWEPGTTQLLPAVWCRGDSRWIWAVNGWAVDEPGDIADLPATAAPSGELSYEVRMFNPVREGETYGVDWVGSHPNWETRSWCYTLAEARMLADAEVRWSGNCTRVQVWGPQRDDPHQRGKLIQLDAATGRPRVPVRPFGTLPGTRPQTPSPALPPGWAPPGRDRRYEYHLRVFSDRTGWISAGWHSCRQFAGVTAQSLCVGVDGHPWQWGDVWGPPRDDADRPVRTLSDLIPDSLFNEPRQPHGYARMPA